MSMEESKLLKKLQEAGENNNLEPLSNASKELADFYQRRDRFEEALQYYANLAKANKILGNFMEVAMAHRMSGDCLMSMDQPENALKQYQLYLAEVQNQTLKIKIEEQRANNSVGRAFLEIAELSEYSSGSLDQAEHSFLKSLLICEDISGQVNKVEQLDPKSISSQIKKVEPLEMKATCFFNISRVKYLSKHYEESLYYKDKSIKICKDHKLYDILHLCYGSKSQLYEDMKLFPLALKFRDLALDTTKHLPDKTQKICESLNLKAGILIKMGKLDDLKQALRKAYLMKTEDSSQKTEIDGRLNIVTALHRIKKALGSITEIAEKGKLLRQMGDGWCLLQNYEKGVEYYSKSIKFLDSNSARKPLYERLGDASCLLQNKKDAIGYYHKALECLNDSENIDELAAMYVSLYETYKDDKQYDKSMKYMWKEYELRTEPYNPEEAIKTLRKIEKLLVLQNKSTDEIYIKTEEARKKAVAMGIDLPEEDYESDNGDNIAMDIEDIGADIVLNTLSDSEVECSEEEAEIIGSDTDDEVFSEKSRSKNRTVTRKPNLKGQRKRRRSNDDLYEVGSKERCIGQLESNHNSKATVNKNECIPSELQSATSNIHAEECTEPSHSKSSNDTLGVPLQNRDKFTDQELLNIFQNSAEQLRRCSTSMKHYIMSLLLHGIK